MTQFIIWLFLWKTGWMMQAIFTHCYILLYFWVNNSPLILKKWTRVSCFRSSVFIGISQLKCWNVQSFSDQFEYLLWTDGLYKYVRHNITQFVYKYWNERWYLHKMKCLPNRFARTSTEFTVTVQHVYRERTWCVSFLTYVRR